MNDKNPLNVGIGEKATNNPPIELLVENEATLNFLSKSLPYGTVAYTRGREKQWQYNGSAWSEIVKPSGLPAVSGSDNGKVLTVVEGEWAPAAGGGGGGGGLVVTITETFDSSTFDKKASEVLAALQSGSAVIVHYPDAEGTENRYGFVVGFASGSGWAEVDVLLGNNPQTYLCDSLDDYPYYSLD